MSFTRQQRHEKTRMIGRSVMRMASQPVDPPRVTMDCQLCGQPSEKLHVVGTRFLCDDCAKKGTK